MSIQLIYINFFLYCILFRRQEPGHVLEINLMFHYSTAMWKFYGLKTLRYSMFWRQR